MTAMDERSVLVAEIDEEIRRGFRGLRFSRRLETRYLAEYLHHRSRMVPLWALIGTIMYLAAIMGDLSLMPDIAQTVITLRIAIFVPYAALVVALMRWRPSPLLFDGLAFGVGFLGISLPMVSLIFSESPHLFVYQAGSIGTLAFFAIVLRPRFLTLVVGLAAMVAVQLVTLHLNGRLDAVTYPAVISFYATLSVFLMLSAYFSESVDRLNFLNRLRGQVLQAQLQALSETDALTGLNNRLMLERTRMDYWSEKASAMSVSAVLIDIDHFKRFNDRHGHLDGDACLRAVARELYDVVAGRGTVVRFGGEELLVLLPHMELAEALELAETMRQSVEDMAIPHLASESGVVTVSLGVHCVRTNAQSLEDLLEKADAALYKAKRLGRNKACAWNEADTDLIEATIG